MGRKKKVDIEEEYVESIEEIKDIQSERIEEEIEEEIEMVDNIEKIEEKKLLCKITKLKNNFLAINFKGAGLQFKSKQNIDDSLIKDYMYVSYTSDIGKPDFKFSLIFE